jgi:hypothetical protein
MLAMAAALLATQSIGLPVRGLHVMAPSAADLPLVEKFIREALPAEGVNTLVVEFDYDFQFKKHPEMADDGALSLEQVTRLVDACKAAKVRLIPQINELGHQSWAESTGRLLTKHPEFDETPGKYPKNKGIYCRSYCPNHPKVHEVVFDCIDELAAACQTDAFHVGMDEIFILADKDCPRCKGLTTAKVFGDEVKRLHDHLKSKGLQMWMWGDRFIDGNTTGMGEWEASANGTQSAITNAPKDIMICDWHYDKAEPSAAYFAMNGFGVVSCPWRKTDVALGELAMMNQVRSGANPVTGQRMMGMLHTTWSDAGGFVRAYNGDPKASASAKESAACFKALCKAMRDSGAASGKV